MDLFADDFDAEEDDTSMQFDAPEPGSPRGRGNVQGLLRLMLMQRAPPQRLPPSKPASTRLEQPGTNQRPTGPPPGAGLLFRPPTPRNLSASQGTTLNRSTSSAHPMSKFGDLLKLSKANMVNAQRVFDVSNPPQTHFVT